MDYLMNANYMQNMLLDIHVFPHDAHRQPPHAAGQADTPCAAAAARMHAPAQAGPSRTLPASMRSGPARLIQIMTVGASRTSRRVRGGCPRRQLDTRLPAARRYRRTPACTRRTVHDAYLRRLYGGMLALLDFLRCAPPCKRPPSSLKRRLLPWFIRSPISPPL